MDQSSAVAFLRALWYETSTELRCNHCGKEIGSDGVLARTLAIQSHVTPDERNGVLPPVEIPVPSLSDVILVFSRHLECLFDSTKYVPISHVWDRHVADAQDRGLTEDIAFAKDVVRNICELPIRIYRGIASGLSSEYFEIWHDYISVPQWHPFLKSQIIQAIPSIFQRAMCTVVHLSDISADSIKAMRKGSSSYEVCRGISDICNTQWFRRTWTAMEWTRSRILRVMLKDFSIVDGHRTHYTILEELNDRWDEQVKSFGNAHSTEQMVGMGNNLVPWQLGPLGKVRGQAIRGFRTEFGTAHDVLARRCVTRPRDFFHALLGMLETGMGEQQLEQNTEEALLQVARSCIEQGDFSPLLMVPSMAQREPEASDLQGYGFCDLSTFVVGSEVLSPTFSDVKFNSGNPIIQVEHVGSVRRIECIDWSKRAWGVLSEIIRLVVDYTGLDIHLFVNTMSRLYGLKPSKVLNLLEQANQLHELNNRIKAIRIRDVPNMEEMTAWIAEAVGLSNRKLESDVVNMDLTPMDFLEAHGGSLHLGDCAVLIAVTCHRCQNDFLLRVALLEPVEHISGAEAFRIPGLRYEHTLAGGAGFLMKNGRVVGRFLWGIPTCACPKLVALEFPLDGIPSPHPNNYQYGCHQEIKEWLHLKLERRIKSWWEHSASAMEKLEPQCVGETIKETYHNLKINM
ncbi:MAG: hypothetical protein M1820_006598 [Bogoriella megaspora]|nr:MAG: hypothetical protein M1820_006598 [Bogoriella megaspora]